MLDASYIKEAEQRARRFSGAFTGTSGTLAADVLRILAERKEIMATLEESNKALRDAVAARLATVPPDDPKMIGYVAPPVLRGHDPSKTILPPVAVIGLAGHIGSGKTEAAAMIPGAHRIQWADPIYRAVAAMLGVSEETLRDRTQKELPISIGGIEVTPRHLTRTLGTEWGRQIVHQDLWVALAMQAIDNAVPAGARVFAICGTRFPNEVAAIRNRGGEVWWIDRPGTTTGSHVSDKMLTRDECDRVIVNNGSLDKLRHNIVAAFNDFAHRDAVA